MRVVFAPEVEEDLYGLIKILVEKEYLGTYPFAISYVEELIADIQQNIHSKSLNPQLHSRSATYIKRNGLLIRKITIKSSRPFQCAYHPLTP